MTVQPLFRRRAIPLFDPDPHSSSRPPFAWPRSRSGRLPDRRSACVAMPARCGADAVPIGQLVARSETRPHFSAEPSRCTSAVHFDACERRSSTFAQAAKATEVADHAAKLDLPRDARFGSDPLTSDARAANLKSVSSAAPRRSRIMNTLGDRMAFRSSAAAGPRIRRPPKHRRLGGEADRPGFAGAL
jgi:hypothetical protein